MKPDSANSTGENPRGHGLRLDIPANDPVALSHRTRKQADRRTSVQFSGEHGNRVAGSHKFFGAISIRAAVVSSLNGHEFRICAKMTATNKRAFARR